MRHGKKFNHLGRKSAHRKAMLANMACSLIEHKRIKTTLAKAKALRVYVEPLITKSKKDSTHSRRVVFSYLQNKEAIKELFGPISDAVASRPGGYTRILKIGPRPGDNAEMAIIELVDFNELAPGKAGSGSSRRRRRKKKKAAGGAKAPAAKAVADPIEDAEVIEESPEVEASPEVEEEQPVEEAVEEAPEAVEEESAPEPEAEAAAEEVVEEAPEAVEEPVAEEPAVEEAPAEEPATEEAAPVEESSEPEVEEAPASEAPAETAEAESSTEAVEATADPDDFRKIEGIGPKISSILHEAGILSFAQLAETSEERLREILADAGSRYKSKDPSTWARQSAFAAEGKWDELKAWQDQLDGGKEK